MLTNFNLRVLSTILSFYKGIEKNEYFQWQYTILGFSGCITFYMWGVFIILGEAFEIDFFIMDKFKYLSFAFLVVVFVHIFQYRKKELIFRMLLNKRKSQYDTLDILSFVYVIGSFAFFIIAVNIVYLFYPRF